MKGKQAGGRGRGTRPAVAAAPSTKSLASVKKGAGRGGGGSQLTSATLTREDHISASDDSSKSPLHSPTCTCTCTHAHLHTHTYTHMHTYMHTRTNTRTKTHTHMHVASCSFLPVISSDNANSPAAAYNVKGKQASGRGCGTRPAVSAAAPSIKSLASVENGHGGGGSQLTSSRYATRSTTRQEGQNGRLPSKDIFFFFCGVDL